MHIKDIPEIRELSVPEKILLLEEIWDSISEDESSIPVPPSHIAELKRRQELYSADPGRLLSLEELKQRIEKRK